jgi:hypothetical protein
VILVLSLILALLPLAGVAWIFISGMITLSPPSATVDGLFMTLILLTVSACFLLNAYLEARDKGFLKSADKKKAIAVPAATPAAKSASATPQSPASTSNAKVPEKVSS